MSKKSKETKQKYEYKPPTEAEKAAARARAKEESKAQAEAAQQAEALFKKRVAEISDDDADKAIRTLGESDKAKLGRFTEAQLKAQGYPKSTLPTSSAYKRAQRQIIKQIMASDMSIGEIDEE